MTLHQLPNVTDPLTHTTTFGYDAMGNLTTITNALNKTTTLTVDARGQPLTIADPLSNITTFTYEAGDLVKVKDPLNRETQRILDAAGRLRIVTNPLGQKAFYTPDALDRITQLTDAINGAIAGNRRPTREPQPQDKRTRPLFLELYFEKRKTAGIRTHSTTARGHYLFSDRARFRGW